MKFLYIGTHGSEDPTRAGLVLREALGAVEAGFDVEVFLAGDAVVLFHDTVAANVKPVGDYPTAKDMLAQLRANKVPVFG